MGINSTKSKTDAANLGDFLKSYYEENSFSLSITKGKMTDFNQWKKAARAKLFELSNFIPVKSDFNEKVLETKNCGSYIRKKILFNTSKNMQVEAYLMTPTKGNGPFPAVLAFHDHGGFFFFGKERIVKHENEHPVLIEYRQKMYEGRPWASELASRGYVVMCIDAFYFGSRKLDVSRIPDNVVHHAGYDFENFEYGSDEYVRKFNDFCAGYEGHFTKYIFYSGTTFPGILFYDDMRCIDYLSSMKEVDKERIGCCGASVGGYRSAHLVALDSRVKCATAAGWMPTAKSHVTSGMRFHTFMIYLPNLITYMELYDAVGTAAPTPLFIQQCTKDQLYTEEGMIDACTKLEYIYEKSGSKNNFIYKFYDYDHRFDIAMQEDAFQWLDKWLTD